MVGRLGPCLQGILHGLKENTKVSNNLAKAMHRDNVHTNTYHALRVHQFVQGQPPEMPLKTKPTSDMKVNNFIENYFCLESKNYCFCSIFELL